MKTDSTTRNADQPIAIFAGIALMALFTSSTALAQRAHQQGKDCPDGQTTTGECIKTNLSDSLRQRTVIFTQPTISWTGLPATDGVPNTLNPAQNRQQSLKDQLTASSPTSSLSSASTSSSSGTFIPLPSGVNPSSLNISGPYTVVPGGIRVK